MRIVAADLGGRNPAVLQDPSEAAASKNRRAIRNCLHPVARVLDAEYCSDGCNGMLAQ